MGVNYHEYQLYLIRHMTEQQTRSETKAYSSKKIGSQSHKTYKRQKGRERERERTSTPK